MEPFELVFGIDDSVRAVALYGSALRGPECLGSRHLVYVQKPGVQHEVWDLLL